LVYYSAVSSPLISVIVPVRNRRALLRRLLDGLNAQTLADHEIIVVDDGSEDGAPEEAALDASRGRPVRLIRNPGRGPYEARQAGVEASSARFIAFTDSDCVPQPKWLEAGVAALESGADVVNGPTVPERPVAPLERAMSSGEEGLYPTCNMFYRRSAFDAVGGFRESPADRVFSEGTTERAWGFGQDTILAWKVRRAGHAAYAPEAVVEHHVFPPDLRDTLFRTRMMVGFPALYREVPELRSHILTRQGVMLNTNNRWPVYAFLLAAASRRWKTAAVAGGWWLSTRIADVRGRPGSLDQRLASIPIQMGLDALGTAELLIGSIRARNLVL
jgi:glycosyltransferase involved in cell wall biosynthesis